MNYLVATFLLMMAAFHSLRGEPYKRIANKDPSGCTIALDDHSVWKVSPGYESQCRYFQPGDLIVIHQVILPSLCNGSKYYFVNQSNKAHINLADLCLGPVDENDNSIRIENIDYFQGRLWLVDQKGECIVWRINGDDIPVLHSWDSGQHIIIGSNTRYREHIASDCDYILINVEKRNYIQADHL